VYNLAVVTFFRTDSQVTSIDLPCGSAINLIYSMNVFSFLASQPLQKIVTLI
jgi:hypothetical protein